MNIPLKTALERITKETGIRFPRYQKVLDHLDYYTDEPTLPHNLNVRKINNRWVVNSDYLDQMIEWCKEYIIELEKQERARQAIILQAANDYANKILSNGNDRIRIGEYRWYRVIGNFHYLILGSSLYYSLTRGGYDEIEILICNICWSQAQEEIRRGPECAHCSNIATAICTHNDKTIRRYCTNCGNEWKTEYD